jgi:nicotinate-nucleotide pyrophosphorylase (carboxylating)
VTLHPRVTERLLAAGLDPDDTERVVRGALHEDFRYGPDLTSAATAAPGARAVASVVARQPGVLAGLPVAFSVLDAAGVPPDAAEPLRTDGDRIGAGCAVLRIRAPLREMLGAERTMLNFVTHLSGIATATRAWADALAGTGAAVRDTRKTTPGLRQLEKYAVRCGGGVNHRMGLGDAALVKDNHVAAAGGVAAAIRAVRGAAPGLPLEVECDSLAQVREALDAEAGSSCLTTWGWLTCAPPWPWPAGTRRSGWRPAGACGWPRPGKWRRRASTSSPSAPSPTPAPPSTWGWICWTEDQQASCSYIEASCVSARPPA